MIYKTLDKMFAVLVLTSVSYTSFVAFKNHASFSFPFSIVHTKFHGSFPEVVNFQIQFLVSHWIR